MTIVCLLVKLYSRFVSICIGDNVLSFPPQNDAIWSTRLPIITIEKSWIKKRKCRRRRRRRDRRALHQFIMFDLFKTIILIGTEAKPKPTKKNEKYTQQIYILYLNIYENKYAKKSKCRFSRRYIELDQFVLMLTFAIAFYYIYKYIYIMLVCIDSV